MNEQYPITYHEPTCILERKRRPFVERMIGVLRWRDSGRSFDDLAEHVARSPKRRAELLREHEMCMRVGGLLGLLGLWREGKCTRADVRALDRATAESAPETERSSDVPLAAVESASVRVENAPSRLDAIEGVVRANNVMLREIRDMLRERSGPQCKLPRVS